MRMVLLGIALAGCQPAPRPLSYFAEHPNEARRIVTACRAGAERGEECGAAAAGLAEHQAKKRENLFKKSFE